MYSTTTDNAVSFCSLKILEEAQKPNYNRTQTRVAWLHSRANKLFLLAQSTQTKWGVQSSDFKLKLYGKRPAVFKILTLCNLRLRPACLPLKKLSSLPINQEHFSLFSQPQELLSVRNVVFF